MNEINDFLQFFPLFVDEFCVIKQTNHERELITIYDRGYSDGSCKS